MAGLGGRSRVVALGALPLLLAGCAPGLGPKALDLLLMLGLFAAAALIALALYDALWSRARPPGSRSIPREVPPGPASARELLDWRYAAGEISRDAWLLAIADLRERDGSNRSHQP